jgi:hypothetical protein
MRVRIAKAIGRTICDIVYDIIYDIIVVILMVIFISKMRAVHTLARSLLFFPHPRSAAPRPYATLHACGGGTYVPERHKRDIANEIKDLALV